MQVNYNALRQERLQRKISLSEMAEVIGLETPGGYSRIEKGDSDLKAKHIPLIANKFNLRINVFLRIIFFEEKVEQTSNSIVKEVI